jgi:hypothetical protein
VPPTAGEPQIRIIGWDTYAWERVLVLRADLRTTLENFKVLHPDGIVFGCAVFPPEGVVPLPPLGTMELHLFAEPRPFFSPDDPFSDSRLSLLVLTRMIEPHILHPTNDPYLYPNLVRLFTRHNLHRMIARHSIPVDIRNANLSLMTFEFAYRGNFLPLPGVFVQQERQLYASTLVSQAREFINQSYEEQGIRGRYH